MSDKQFLIIKGDASYHVLRAAADEIKETFTRWGYQPVEMDLTQYDLSREEDMKRFQELLFQPYAFIFSFQALLGNVFADGRSILEYTQVPCFCWLMDHPLFHTEKLEGIGQAENVLIMVVDGHHVSYLQTYHPYIRNMAHLPHAGFKAEQMPEKKDIDVFFSGTYIAPEDLLEEANDISESFRTVMLGAAACMLEDEALAVEDAFCRYFEKIGFAYTAEDIVTMHDIVGWVDEYVRCYYREKGIRELLQAGIAVTVVGRGWDSMKLSEDEKCNLIILENGPVNIEETIVLTARSKIVLNLVSSFHQGMHERIPTAMLNHAVCVTMYSDYLAEQFEEDKEIVLFSFREDGKLAEKVQFLLEHPAYAEAIAQRAYEKASGFHTWECRARDIRGVVEDGTEEQCF